MSHYRQFFESSYMGAWDLIDPEGRKRERTLTITKVEGAIITGENGKKDKKPLIHFEGLPLPMICNKTNAKACAGMYGVDTREWIGRRVTLYVASVAKPGSGNGEMVDAIRIRPMIPQQTGKGKSDAAAE